MQIATRQPVRPVVRRLTLPADSSNLKTARHWVARAAASGGLDGDRAHRFVYAVNEAVTNAIRHGRPDARGMIRLYTVIEHQRVTIHVQDSGTFELPISEPDPAGEHGRGFPLMRRFADEVRLSVRPGATTVSLSVDCAS